MKLATGFSGIEGFGLAAQRCGMELVAMSEVDRFCCKVLAHRFPGVPNLGDIREVTGDAIRAAASGTVDVWAGGWPCQDLSVAGLRAGLVGERSGLFREVVRILAELAPEWFLLENVPGLFSSYRPLAAPPEPVDVLGRPAQAGDWEVDEDSDFEEVLASLTELGYGVAWRCLDARYFGLAQRRERAILVGHRGDVRRAAAVLFEPESCGRDSASRRRPGPGVAASLTHGSYSARHQPGRRREDDENLVAYALTSHHGRNNQESTYVRHTLLAKAKDSHAEDLDTYVVHTLRAAGFDASEDGTGRGVPLLVVDEHNGASAQHEVAQTLSSGAGRSKNRVGAIAWDLAQITSPDNRATVSDAVAPTLSRRGEPMYGVRRLMPVECERLMGFPDGWTCLHDHPQQCDCPDGPRYQAVGNAVAVPVAEWVLRRMRRVHEGILAAREAAAT